MVDQHSGLQEWSQALAQPIQKQKLQTLLQVAESAQTQAQESVLALTFRQLDDAGEHIRQSQSEVALQPCLVHITPH
jgi:hypothetical protein